MSDCTDNTNGCKILTKLWGAQTSDGGLLGRRLIRDIGITKEGVCIVRGENECEIKGRR